MPVALEQSEYAAARPRLGFAGLGWIGAQRMQVLASSGAADQNTLTWPTNSYSGFKISAVTRLLA